MKSKVDSPRVDYFTKICKRVTVLSIISFFYACQDSSGNLDVEFLEFDSEIIQIDTLTLKTGTVNMDSVITGASPRILSGRYLDPFLGEIHADSYLKFILPNEFSVPEEATFKSFKLIFDIDYFYGESDRDIQLDIYRLAEEIEPDEDENTLYNFNKFQFEEMSIGSISFVPDEIKDSVSIILSDDLGKEIFDAAKAGEDFVSIDEDFQSFFKGLVVVGSNEKNTSVLGFPFEFDFVEENTKSTPRLELTYDEPDGDIIEEKTFHFNLSEGGSFSNIYSERPFHLEELNTSKKYISSSKTSDLSYIQSGLGLMTRIEFPTLLNVLNNIPKDYFLVGAELIIKPIKESYGDETPLPDDLLVFIADDKNNIESSLLDPEGNPVTAFARIDEEFNYNTLYKFDVTSFVDSELNSLVYPSGRSLLLSTNNSVYQNTVTRVVLGGSSNKEHEVFINIILYKSSVYE